jgi:hypothetical protein
MGYFMLLVVLPVAIGLIIAGRRQSKRDKANK